MVIRISRHGLTRCPTCERHVRLVTVVHAASCPFCGAAIASRPPARGGLLGRTGNALAASLVSFGLGSACLSEGERARPDAGDTGEVSDVTGDVRPDAGQDGIPQPVYGLPIDVIVDTIDVPDTIDADDLLPQPEYGLPMEDVVDARDTGPSEDIPFQPLYGGPPIDVEDDASDPGDARDATEVQPAEDIGIEPLYGLPFPNDVVETADADDALPQPEYGLPFEDARDDNDGDDKDADARDSDAGPVPRYGLPPG